MPTDREWWEEPWALPVFAVFVYGMYKFMMESREQALAQQQQVLRQQQQQRPAQRQSTAFRGF